jgi:hypothetical protein
VFAEIITTSKIEEILPEIEPGTLVLFNIAEVLLDTETSLGRSAWRRDVRKNVDSKIHDFLTHYVVKRLPPKGPDAGIPSLIQGLQKSHVPVFAFTSRGRSEWYSSKVAAVHALTEDLLKQLGIDFTQTVLPAELADLDQVLAEHYHGGIFYTGNSVDKGDFLKTLMQITGYRPPKIVFIDDKVESLKSLEARVQELNIPFTGVAYNKTSLDHQKFDLMLAHIQLSWLILAEYVFSDEDAMMIKIETQVGVNPEQHFSDLITSIDFEYLYQKTDWTTNFGD